VLCKEFRSRLIYWPSRVLPHRPNRRLEDHFLSVVQGCLCSLFVVTFHIWRPSPFKI